MLPYPLAETGYPYIEGERIVLAISDTPDPGSGNRPVYAAQISFTISTLDADVAAGASTFTVPMSDLHLFEANDGLILRAGLRAGQDVA